MKFLARTPKDIGHAIRQVRIERGLTQKELASISGIWQETISKIENDISATKLETIFNLLAALDLEIQLQARTKGDETDLEDIF